MKYEKYKDLYTQFLISEKNLSKKSIKQNPRKKSEKGKLGVRKT